MIRCQYCMCDKNRACLDCTEAIETNDLEYVMPCCDRSDIVAFIDGDTNGEIEEE